MWTPVGSTCCSELIHCTARNIDEPYSVAAHKKSRSFGSSSFTTVPALMYHRNVHCVFKTPEQSEEKRCAERTRLLPTNPSNLSGLPFNCRNSSHRCSTNERKIQMIIQWVPFTITSEKQILQRSAKGFRKTARYSYEYSRAWRQHLDVPAYCTAVGHQCGVSTINRFMWGIPRPWKKYLFLIHGAPRYWSRLEPAYIPVMMKSAWVLERNPVSKMCWKNTGWRITHGVGQEMK